MTTHHSVDCDRMLDELQDVLRGEATPETAAAVEQHLAICAPCLRHVKFEERFLALLRSCAARERIAPDVRERLLASLRRGS
jgi:anti-sigma factor (TIGR02949 family)